AGMTMAKKPAGSNGEQTRQRGMARAGRSALSRDRIVTAALALIERDGLASFSIRKLGDSLGVEAMSVYHYFRSKRHLLAEPVDDAYIVAHCPRLASVARYFKEPEWNATFEFGLEALIAGFRAAVDAPRGAKPPLTSARRNRRRNVAADRS